jgi:hypothetical protein
MGSPPSAPVTYYGPGEFEDEIIVGQAPPAAYVGPDLDPATGAYTGPALGRATLSIESKLGIVGSILGAIAAVFVFDRRPRRPRRRRRRRRISPRGRR